MVAVVSLKTPWRDPSTNMNIYWPSDAGTVTRGGERPGDGRRTETFVEVDLTALATVASTNVQIVAENVSIPKGAFIQDVEIVTTKAVTSGGSATLDIGLVDLADRTTEIDFNGIAAAVAKTAIASVGTHNQIYVGGTGAGALLGTATSKAGLITVNAGTADFTAGKIEIRVHWFMPNSADL